MKANVLGEEDDNLLLNSSLQDVVPASITNVGIHYRPPEAKDVFSSSKDSKVSQLNLCKHHWNQDCPLLGLDQLWQSVGSGAGPELTVVYSFCQFFGSSGRVVCRGGRSRRARSHHQPMNLAMASKCFNMMACVLWHKLSLRNAQSLPKLQPPNTPKH